MLRLPWPGLFGHDFQAGRPRISLSSSRLRRDAGRGLRRAHRAGDDYDRDLGRGHRLAARHDLRQRHRAVYDADRRSGESAVRDHLRRDGVFDLRLRHTGRLGAIGTLYRAGVVQLAHARERRPGDFYHAVAAGLFPLGFAGRRVSEILDAVRRVEPVAGGVDAAGDHVLALSGAAARLVHALPNALRAGDYALVAREIDDRQFPRG